MIKKTSLVLLGIIFTVWIIGLIVFLWKINHFNDVSQRKTEAIIALTGGRNRIAEAFKLLEKKESDKLFITGVGKNISLEHIGNTQHIDFTPDSRIEIGNQASNTVENAIEAHHWIEENKIQSIRLVTSNYHIIRSFLEFKEYNPNLAIIIHPVYSENIEKKWWTSWRTFSLLFKEYNKLLYVLFKNISQLGELKDVISTLVNL